MAKGNVMLQLEVSQIFAAAVTFVPQINALVFDTFDGNLTRIREIAIQKVGHHSGTPNVKAFQTSSEIALQQVFWYRLAVHARSWYFMAISRCLAAHRGL